MSLKSEINRWIVASVNRHFDARKETIYLHIEGMVRKTNEYPDHTELKIDGPYFLELSRNYFNVFIEINVLIQAQALNSDAYSHLRMCSIVQKSFTRCIPVHRYGDGVEDDGTFVGVLVCVQGFRQKVVESHFGQIKPSENLVQSQIEGHYEMNLEMNND